LLIKLIDANNKLSVQVHPDDQYAKNTGCSDYGKNEMWYILEAKPGARIVHDIKQGITKEAFVDAIEKGNVEACLNYVYVASGDTINIPAGTVHALGEGIVLVEIQQNSNLTYRVYDYNRVDKSGNKRELHVDKALDIINFDSENSTCKISPISVSINKDFVKTDLISNKYFSVERYDVNGKVFENADGSKFFIYIILDGECGIVYKNGREKIAKGESVLVPAYTGYYTLNGKFQALKTYVPK
jgi:mannose-6-phosphate isomerase